MPYEKPRILIFDIEVIPNLIFEFDLKARKNKVNPDFVLESKSICCIAWKWMGEKKIYSSRMKEPYNDKRPLKEFYPFLKEATHTVAHYSKFDRTHIAGRLAANKLPAYPPVCDICTWQLASKHFGDSLNGNGLDNLAEHLGVARKLKTGAMLWREVALGKKKALDEMVRYNKRDVEVLEGVLFAMLPHVESKINHNLFTDTPTLHCNHCYSDNLEYEGLTYNKATYRHRFKCVDCGSWNTYKKSVVK